MRFTLLAAVCILAAGFAIADDGESPLARDLVERIEARQSRTRDLVARFEQSYRSGLLGRELVERGVVSIKRPGRMRWEYQEPEKKLFVADGESFYFYVPEDAQVIIQEQDDQRSLAARLLFGQGGILEEFEASLEEPLEEGVLRVRLVPRKGDAEIAQAFVDAEPSGLVRAILIEDLQGNRTQFRFQGLRENRGLSDDLFRFEIPPGVEVVRG